MSLIIFVTKLLNPQISLCLSLNSKLDKYIHLPCLNFFSLIASFDKEAEYFLDHSSLHEKT